MSVIQYKKNAKYERDSQCALLLSSTHHTRFSSTLSTGMLCPFFPERVQIISWVKFFDVLTAF